MRRRLRTALLEYVTSFKPCRCRRYGYTILPCIGLNDVQCAVANRYDKRDYNVIAAPTGKAIIAVLLYEIYQEDLSE